MLCKFTQSSLVLFILFLSIKNGLSSKSCDFNGKMFQRLHNNGFHRNLTYKIELTNVEGSRLKNCWLGLDQTLPPGVFANPDELGDLLRMGKITAIPKNKVDVERPAHQSSASGVFLMAQILGDVVHLWMPLHARYHRAVSGGGVVKNEINPPQVYLRCDDKALEDCDHVLSPTVTFLCNMRSIDTCTWKTLPHITITDTMIWKVPVGNSDRYYIVAIGTAVVIAMGSLYLLKILHDRNVAFKIKLN